MTKNRLLFSNLNVRHPGVTLAIGASYDEAARVCLDPSPDKIAQTLLDILRAASESPDDGLQRIVKMDDYRRTFLKMTRNLAPTGKTFNQIEIGSTNDISPVILSNESRQLITQTLRPMVAERELPVIVHDLNIRRNFGALLIECTATVIQRCVEAALCGARIADHRPIKSMTPKRGRKMKTPKRASWRLEAEAKEERLASAVGSTNLASTAGTCTSRLTVEALVVSEQIH